MLREERMYCEGRDTGKDRGGKLLTANCWTVMFVVGNRRDCTPTDANLVLWEDL